MGLFKNYVSQTRKPEGKLGKMMLNGMNSGHAKMADWGVDYSSLSVEKASDYNKDIINAGRLEVRQGDVSALDIPDGKFDLATAFETIYFWPGLERCFVEVARILKDGGYFMIVNESDGTDAASLKFEKIIDGMKCYTTEQITEALREAGFSKIKTDHHKTKSWITVIAKK